MTDSQTSRALFQLRELLLRGEFPAGERLSELSLVARLGVSRTPIRLALQKLAHQGLLEALPSAGFMPRQFNLADVWDAIEVRGALEGTAARLAAERFGSAEELRTLRAYQSRMDTFDSSTAESFALYMDWNEAFHSALIDLAKSPMLRRSIEQVNALPFASPSAMVYARSRLPQAKQMFAIGQEHHHAIIEAVAHRQGARAESLAREHALLSRRNLERALMDRAIMSFVPGASLIAVPEYATPSAP
jgi:GntR family transcriptional regulator of vanillate catabolism